MPPSTDPRLPAVTPLPDTTSDSRTGVVRQIAAVVRTAWLSYRALFTWLNPSSYLAIKILWPIEQIIFFSLVGRYGAPTTPADFFVIGNAVHSMALSGVFGVSLAVGGERWSGTLPYIFGSPVSRVMVFWTRTLFHLMDALLGLSISLAVSSILFDLDISRVNLAMLILALATTAFSISGIGLLVGSISLLTANVMFFNNAVYAAMLLVCGVNVPVASLPPILQWVSASIPLTQGLEAVRMVFRGGQMLMILNLVLKEALVGVVYALLGYAFFKLLEYRARKAGTLEFY
jgi:ABC-2 type transport system permease protein